MWNQLPNSVRCANSLETFKVILKQYILPPKPPKYYGNGPRFSSIHHTRLRMKCNTLNHYMNKFSIIESPMCDCGFPNETELHYVLHCTKYEGQRTSLVESLIGDVGAYFNIERLLFNQQDALIMSSLLFGSSELPNYTNILIFQAMYTFIHQK